MNPKLSILIPTTNNRLRFNDRIISTLEWQRAHLVRPFEVQVLFSFDDNKTIGEKRNDLVKEAKGTIMAFVDSDDVICDGYLQHGLDCYDSGMDAATLTGLYFINGIYDRPFYHSDKYHKWYQDDKAYYRTVNHLNFIKTAIAKQIPYEHKSFGEDGVYSEQLKASGLIKTQFQIEQCLYLYFARTKHDGI